ncbi:nucleotide sugar dehydrogenase [Pleionea litopenaei]|uniref:Nucleotide sugar dehydrogenase n=1 Tax=Pleionea litopenaei TaxID=3070815 RepID=A0AA51RVM8_9GAMM|nr:nucleotide sugar dehydrogenase [Pleionea sp. HL-JVS1]WMS88422.1 nucleotide sugar dehydrogenase [Pleionea sp. HL-JVS1]
MQHKRKVSVIGLGYVGLPVAVAFGHQQPVIGFDIDPQRIAELQEGIDKTLEVEPTELKQTSIVFTDSVDVLRQADFHIVAVPTPINEARKPDLRPMLSASKTVGRALKKGDIVVFESTVYPGATEEDCVPILEAESGLRCGVDFTVGYSPERINPGDKEHTFTKITKIVSGQDAATLDIVAAVYESVVTAGVYKASSIKVAEAAKVIENTQRDLNIALMNELSLIFQKMNIDTLDVLEAAGTKWNFLPFRPGLVGGHCIGVDPYYLTHKAELIGHHPEVILAGRKINDDMGKVIVQNAVKKLIRAGKDVSKAKVAVLGLTFKENCPDLRNSKVIDIIDELRSFGVEPIVHDPMASKTEALHEYQVELADCAELVNIDLMIVAVAHREYCGWELKDFSDRLSSGAHVFDVKGILDREAFAQSEFHLSRI